MSKEDDSFTERVEKQLQKLKPSKQCRECIISLIEMERRAPTASDIDAVERYKDVISNTLKKR